MRSTDQDQLCYSANSACRAVVRSIVTVRHRHTANKILKATGHQWAFSALTRSLGCRAHYDRRRAAGDRHTAALRNLYNRLLRCLHHCLITNVYYDEARAFPSSPAE